MESDAALPPQDQLAMIAEARAAAADRLVTPWWYHPILGFLLAGYVVALSLGDTVVKVVALPVFLGGLGLLVHAYRRLTGVWISGFEAGPAGRWAYAMGGAIAVAMVGSLAISWTTSLAWPTWVLAGLLFAAVIVVGRRFDVALRAQLRAGA